jgi:hypothetical protein
MKRDNVNMPIFNTAFDIYKNYWLPQWRRRSIATLRNSDVSRIIGSPIVLSQIKKTFAQADPVILATWERSGVFLELPPRRQLTRMCRSKKRRIKKKWLKNPANWEYVYDNTSFYVLPKGDCIFSKQPLRTYEEKQ